MNAGLANKMRILIGYLQITSALLSSFDIPWPPMTMQLLQSLTFVNFNFMEFFLPLDPCVLHTSFLSQAAFHMAILPICALVVVVAAVCATCCGQRKVVVQRAKTAMVTIVFLLYPGIVTRVFTTLKCRTIGTTPYLVADYSVVCGQGKHAIMALVMAVFALVYVVGIPLGSTLVLFCNRRLMRLDNEAEQTSSDTVLLDKASRFHSVFGALYNAYEPHFWYFESLIMIQKALLTGGLVLVAVSNVGVGLVVLVVFFAFCPNLLFFLPSLHWCHSRAVPHKSWSGWSLRWVFSRSYFEPNRTSTTTTINCNPLRRGQLS
jgi:uncharacterized membrane protein